MLGLKKHLTILSLLLASSLIGCAATPEIVTRTIVKKQEIPLRAHPRPIQLNGVRWYVITSDNVEEFLFNYEKKNGAVAVIATSVIGYENLSLNLSEIRRYIEQQQAIIDYYESQVAMNNNINKTNAEENSE
jgi:hypothetical protein